MTETKKKNRKPSSAGKSPAKRNSAKSGTGTKQKRTKNAVRQQRNTRHISEKKSFLRGEVAAIILLFAAVFLFLSVIGWMGTAGRITGGVLKGLFGAFSYLFPFYLLFAVFYTISVRDDELFGIKLTAMIGLLFVAVSLGQLFFGSGDTVYSWKEAYHLAENGSFIHSMFGGAIGNLIAGGLRQLLGKAGAFLILFLLFLIILVILSEKSIISVLRRSAEKTAAAAKNESVRMKQRFDEEQIRRHARREAEELRRKEALFEQDISASENRIPDSKSTELRTPAEPERISDEKTAEESVRTADAPKTEADFIKTEAEEREEPSGPAEAQRVSAVPETFSGNAAVPEVIKIGEAAEMGFAAGKTYRADFPAIKPEAGIEPASEPEKDFLDYGYIGAAYEDNLHPPLAPEEIFYPDPADGNRSEPETGLPEQNQEQTFSDSEKTGTVPETAAAEEWEEKTASEKYAVSVQEEKRKKTKEQALEELEKRRAAEEKEKKTAPRPYQFPPVALLKKGVRPQTENSADSKGKAAKLEEVLASFGVGVTVTNIVTGPRVTRFELTPDVGVKLSRITSLAGDIKLALAARELRIEAPIPGKSAVGIEIPNDKNATVMFRDILETAEFRNASSRLTWGIGLDIQGAPVVGDIAKMPHLLVSGTTGSGKSVGINSIIMSVIYRARPEEVRMILVDPKVVELSVYDGIPHLLAPVVTKPDQALAILNKACEEMNYRYRLFKESNTRNIKGYNEKVSEAASRIPDGVEKPQKLPYILIIIDELSELMMHSKRDVEAAIVSLTQLARAAGIHLVVATQRPSVDVVTGLIKSNIPSRVAYRLPSMMDSRTILDSGGAETLLGNGDMLYKPGDKNNPLRVQGAFLSDEEVEAIVSWLKKHNSAAYDEEWKEAMKAVPQADAGGAGMELSAPSDDGRDEYFYEAGDLITEKKKASIGLLQRKFKIGFNRAARIMDELNEAGVVSDSEGTKERQILMSNEDFREIFGNGSIQ